LRFSLKTKEKAILEKRKTFLHNLLSLLFFSQNEKRKTKNGI